MDNIHWWLSRNKLVEVRQAGLIMDWTTRDTDLEQTSLKQIRQMIAPFMIATSIDG
jgi:hypothetical protein